MNILRELKNNKVNFYLDDLDLDDMAVSYEIKSLLENTDFILEIINQVKTKIDSLDDYINYIYVNHICGYEKALEIVKDDYKENFKRIIDSFINKKDTYLTKDLVIFITNNYKEIFDYKDIDLYIDGDIKDFTVKYIAEHRSLCNFEILEYIADNYSYLLIDYHDKYKKILSSNDYTSIYYILLSEKNIKKNIYLRSEKIEQIIKSINKDSNIFDKLISNYINATKELFFDASGEDVIRVNYQLHKCRDFLAKLKRVETHLYDEECERNDQLQFEYLEKNGNVFKTEIDLSPIFEFVDDNSINITKRMFGITERINDKGEYVTILQNALKNTPSPIYDSINHTEKNDNVFLPSRKIALRYKMASLERTVNHIIRVDEKRIDFISHIGGSFKYYLDKNKIKYNEKMIEDDINMLNHGIEYLIESNSEHNETKTKYAAFSCIMFTCVLIEKYLRYIYSHAYENDMYINDDNTSLKTFLKDARVRKLIGEENADCFEYYLLGRAGVGINLRNDTGHYNKEINEKLNYATSLTLLSLLLILANRMLIIV